MRRKEGTNGMSLTKRLLPLLLLSLAVAALAGQGSYIIERSIYSCPTWEAAVKQTDVENYSPESEYAIDVGNIDDLIIVTPS
jgi:hypothetical protein